MAILEGTHPQYTRARQLLLHPDDIEAALGQPPRDLLTPNRGWGPVG